MKGKSYSIPIGMVFKKYYCHKCGNKLGKRKTHRVVKKGDKDYYQYQDYNTFPRYDQDVYDYHFYCKQCDKLIATQEQYIVERIQKKLKSKRLASFEIEQNYKIEKQKENKKVLIRNILIPIIFLAISIFLIYIFAFEHNIKILIALISLFVIISILIIWTTIYSYKGKRQYKYNTSYSHDEEALYEKLHTYAYNNKTLIDNSLYCYCFYCKSKIDSKDITKYIDENKTALCPKCGIDSIIADSIDEKLDSNIIDGMNKYWF